MHDIKKTKVNERYVEGGYLNVEEYHKETLCERCGMIMNDDITYGGYS